MSKFIKILLGIVVAYLAIGVIVYLFIKPSAYDEKINSLRLEYGRSNPLWSIVGWPYAWIP